MTNEHQQPYDSTLKALVQTYAAVILPLEFESGPDKYMASRLLTYHAIIFQEYQLPVISIVIYPFEVIMAESPLRETSRLEELLTFHFKVLPLWKLNAEYYVNIHALCMYALLPTMQGVTDELLLQAMKELTEHYKDDEVMVARQFVWMGIMLRRSNTISQEDKHKIQRELHMYDKLWDEDPEIQRIKAEAEVKGEVRALQKAVIVVVGARFPNLADLAEENVTHIHNLTELDKLVKQVATIPDEATALWFLRSLAA